MLKSSIFVTVLSITVSLVSFFNQALIAKYFGAGQLLDVYLTLSSIALLISALITSGLSYYLTPFIVKEKLDNPLTYRYFTGSLFVLIMSISAIVCVILAVLLSINMSRIYPNLKSVDEFLLTTITIATWLNAVVNIGIGYYNCLLNANKQFLLPVLISFLPYIGVIICCVFFSNTLSITAISIGLVAGALTSLAIAMVVAKKEIIFNLRKEYFKKNKAILGYLPLVIFAMLSFSVYQSIDSFWAPRLGNSNLSYLGYCQRILVALGVLVITGPSTVLVPHLTEAVVEKRDDDFYKTVASVAKIVFTLAGFIGVVCSVLSFPIIQLMFQRGKFTLIDTFKISKLLPFMLTGMTFMLSVVLLFRVLFIKEKIRAVAVIGSICAILYFTFSGIAVVIFKQVSGIGMSYISTWFVVLIVTLKVIFNKNESYFFNKKTAFYFLKLLVNFTIVYIACYNLFNLLDHLSLVYYYKDMVQCVIVGLGGLTIFLFLSLYVTKLDDLGTFVGRFRLSK